MAPFQASLFRSFRVVIIVLLAVLARPVLATAAGQTESRSLIGAWQCEFFGESMALVFQSDSQLMFDGEAARYSRTPGTLLVYEEGIPVEYPYFLQGNTLKLSFPDGSELDCKRSGTPSRSGSSETSASARASSVTPPAQGRGSQVPPVTISSEEVGNPSWGFKFRPPKGWKHQSDHAGALLGHDSIPGLILVAPHQESSMDALTQAMARGLNESDFSLRPAGPIQRQSSDTVVCDASGIAQGQQVKGRAIGTLSPYGGGAYVIAITTPEQFEKGIVEAAAAIPPNIQYFKVDNIELVRHFSGMWASYSGNSAGGTLINYDFYPNGTFSDSSETSYNINTPDSNIGFTGTGQEQARWTVSGTIDSGQIIIRYPNGNERTIDYQIFIENGRKYSREVLFNRRHFSKRKDY